MNTINSECFQGGNLCGINCTCKDCKNILEESGPTGLRTKRIQQLLLKRPDAFDVRVKKKGLGCSCKNSQCLKKYCRCFSEGSKCKDSCKCVNCKNMGDDVVIGRNNGGLGGAIESASGASSIEVDDLEDEVGIGVGVDVDVEVEQEMAHSYAYDEMEDMNMNMNMNINILGAPAPAPALRTYSTSNNNNAVNMAVV